MRFSRSGRPRIGAVSIHPWLPHDARNALDILRRPSTTALERALAASLFLEAVKRMYAPTPSPMWISLVVKEIQRAAPDLVEPNDLAASDDSNRR